MENGIATNKPVTLQSLLTQESVKKRFEEMLGKKAAGFISSIMSATKLTPALQRCKPETILSASVIAATLDLPIQNNLGFAALVPYGDEATFQMMWRGYVQLAMRTGQYKTMNVCEVYEGELIKYDRFTGEMVLDETKKSSDKIIGYTAFFKMVNGFEKRVYWTVQQIEAHGKKYSKSYAHSSGQWKLNFDAMAKKTVLKMLLSKFGILSVDMQLQQAIVADQSVPTEDGEFEYVDNTGNPGILDPMPTADDLRELLELKRDSIKLDELKDANRIINDNEVDSFRKLQKFLQSK